MTLTDFPAEGVRDAVRLAVLTAREISDTSEGRMLREGLSLSCARHISPGLTAAQSLHRISDDVTAFVVRVTTFDAVQGMVTVPLFDAADEQQRNEPFYSWVHFAARVHVEEVVMRLVWRAIAQATGTPLVDGEEEDADTPIPAIWT